MPDLSISQKSRAAPWLLSILAVVMVLFQLFGETLVPLLRFEREAILTGEYWRLFSGHLVHLNWSHLLLNLAGLACVYLLSGNRLGLATWILTGFLSVLAIDAGLLHWNSQLQWYTGLSGVLHAWFTVSILTVWRQHGWHTGVLLLGLLTVKLGWELWRGPPPGTTELIGGTVVVEAHFFGALAGIAATAILEIAQRISRRANLYN